MVQDKCPDNFIKEAGKKAFMTAVRHLCPHPEGKKVLLLSEGSPETYIREALSELEVSGVFTDFGNDADLVINIRPDTDNPEDLIEHFIDLSSEDSVPCFCLLDLTGDYLRTDLVLAALERGILSEGSLYYKTALDKYSEGMKGRRAVSEEEIEQTFRKKQKEKENIVLTGMPGAGKSAAGEAIAKALKKTFMDTDAAIIEKAGRQIADIFYKEGESYFRDLETEMILELSEKQDMVLSTGGGVILRPENVRALKRNGRIYFLDRPIDYIFPSDDRPLSDTVEKVMNLYRERYPLYLRTADERLIPGSVVEETVSKILKEWAE